jgi:hypothetical protein
LLLVHFKVFNSIVQEAFNSIKSALCSGRWDFQVKFRNSQSTVLRLDDVSIKILETKIRVAVKYFSLNEFKANLNSLIFQGSSRLELIVLITTFLTVEGNDDNL